MQLFNLKEDPSEKKNIISNKRYKKDVDKMTQMIKKYVEEGRSTQERGVRMILVIAGSKSKYSCNKQNLEVRI